MFFFSYYKGFFYYYYFFTLLPQTASPVSRSCSSFNDSLPCFPKDNAWTVQDVCELKAQLMVSLYRLILLSSQAYVSMLDKPRGKFGAAIFS